MIENELGIITAKQMFGQKRSDLSSGEVFLATTSLEDFWDTTKTIVFLGEWCRRYSRSDFWNPLGDTVIPFIWDTQGKKADFYHYVNDVYERLFSHLYEILNQSNRTCYSRRYWRIIMGLWLYYYVALIYEKYSYIQEAWKRFPLITTIGLSEDCFVVPIDMLDFIQYMREDSYNLQVFTKILAGMGKDFSRKKTTVRNQPFGAPGKEFILSRILKGTLKKTFGIFEKTFQEGKSVILKNSYFPRLIELELILLTRGKVWTNNLEPLNLSSLPLDLEIRSQLKEIKLGNSEFERLLVEILPLEIPQCYIESFSRIKDYAQKNYPQKIKAIFTSNAWCFNESFKHWAADAAEKGAILLGGQHGGNYGSIALLPTEDYEIAVTDRFYSWGWEHQEHKKRVFPMPAPYLFLRKSFSADNKKGGILLGSALSHRYFLVFPYFSSNFYDYLIWQCRFFKKMKPELRARMRIRLHRDDYGWDVAQQIKTNFPEIVLENWNVVFLKSLENCRLYVCDNLQTTFVEALSANKPTVMFWNPNTNLLRKEARPYYDQLIKSGMLYYSPEEAAMAVNSIYDDVESWWNDPDRQLARKCFCNRFSRTSTDGVKEWVEEFKDIYSVNKKRSIL